MAFPQAIKKNSGKPHKIWRCSEVIPYPGANGVSPFPTPKWLMGRPVFSTNRS
jgi:hypothetical protein